MLKDMNRENYHTFRFRYWDWTKDNRNDIFRPDRLGIHDDSGVVSGNLFNGGWETTCWHARSGTTKGTTCNPLSDTRYPDILRCPQITNDRDYPRGSCEDSPNWPTLADVNIALEKNVYDNGNYDFESNSFRNYMEGFEVDANGECNNKRLCSSKTSLRKSQ